MDYTPAWLKATEKKAIDPLPDMPPELLKLLLLPPLPPPPECTDEIEVDVDVSEAELVDYLAPHQKVAPKEKRWTPALLRRERDRLKRQLEKERALHAELAGLREECIELTMELQTLRQRRTSIGMP